MGRVSRWGRGCLVLAALLALAWSARAEVRFGANDVRTVFFISKSDDRNRVDYGIHLDESCQPVGRRPIYGYWHRFEPNQPRVGDLRGMDRRAYGVHRQSVRSRANNGSWIEMRIASVPRERILVLARRGSDGCEAHAQVQLNGGDAILERIHVELSGPMRIDHVMIHGRDPSNGQILTDRRRPPAGPLIPGLGG